MADGDGGSGAGNGGARAWVKSDAPVCAARLEMCTWTGWGRGVREREQGRESERTGGLVGAELVQRGHRLAAGVVGRRGAGEERSEHEVECDRAGDGEEREAAEQPGFAKRGPRQGVGLIRRCEREGRYTQGAGTARGGDVEGGHNVDDEAPLFVAERTEEEQEAEGGKEQLADAAVESEREEREREGG
jgi:hypothetical protein